MTNIDGFCLTYFDAVIIEINDGRINRPSLGAAWNYFGTLIKGSGRFVSDDADITVNQGETIFIPKGCVYRSEWSGSPKAVFYSLPFVFSDSENNTLFSLQKVNDKDISSDVAKIYEDKERGSLSCLSRFYSCFDRVSAHLEKAKLPARIRSVYPAIKHIESYCDNRFDVPFLAKLCGMSQSNFYALFKKETGMTPIEYKNRRRCIKAAELLCSTDYTVEYISEKLNFSSPMYLRKVLFSCFGKTPREIRKEKLLLL